MPPKKTKKKKRPVKKYAPRADLGAPIDGFVEARPPELQAILKALRSLVEEVAPEATASIKWGMPFYQLEGKMFCALGAHKSHVNLILAGPPKLFEDPQGRLTGSGKTGRHLKLTASSEIPKREVRAWLKAAKKFALE